MASPWTLGTGQALEGRKPHDPNFQSFRLVVLLVRLAVALSGQRGGAVRVEEHGGGDRDGGDHASRVCVRAAWPEAACGAERLGYLVQQCGCTVVVAQRRFRGLIEALQVTLVVLVEDPCNGIAALEPRQTAAQESAYATRAVHLWVYWQAQGGGCGAGCQVWTTQDLSRLSCRRLCDFSASFQEQS